MGESHGSFEQGETSLLNLLVSPVDCTQKCSSSEPD